MHKKPVEKKDVMRSILLYCDYQDRCILEVRKKLKKSGLSAQECHAFIDELIKQDAIDESRYAQNFARGKFRIKQWGKIRIRAALRAKQIPNDLIQSAIKSIEDSLYQEVLHQLAVRKEALIPEADKQIRRKKLWDMLIYRGWEKEMVYEKVKELIP